MQWTVLLGKFDFIIITFSFWLSTGIFRRSCNSCHVLGCEIWSFEIVDIIKSLLLRFLNYNLNLKSSIPNIIGISRNWTLWYRFGEDWYSEMCRIIHIYICLNRFAPLFCWVSILCHLLSNHFASHIDSICILIIYNVK